MFLHPVQLICVGRRAFFAQVSLLQVSTQNFTISWTAQHRIRRQIENENASDGQHLGVALPVVTLQLICRLLRNELDESGVTPGGVVEDRPGLGADTHTAGG